MISQQTFPGVYTRIKDDSFLTNVVSRFRCGLVGVANKGPFDTVVNTRSLKEFRRNFGTAIPGQYLATAVACISDFTDGIFIVRVGNQYTRAATITGSGGSDQIGDDKYQIYTPAAKMFNINDFIRVSQAGKLTTANAQVASYLPLGVTQNNATGLQLASGDDDVALADTYTTATIDKSDVSGAASNAEAFLYAYDYTPPLTLLGNVTGDKNAKQFKVSGTVIKGVVINRTGTTAYVLTQDDTPHGLAIGDVVNIGGTVDLSTGISYPEFSGLQTVTSVNFNPDNTPNTSAFRFVVATGPAMSFPGALSSFTSLVPGDIIRITQDNKKSTLEVMVRDVLADGTIHLEPGNISERGYHALALQDNYTATGPTPAQVSRVKRNSDGSPVLFRIMHLMAATAGTWANSDGSKTGLIVRVAPGSAPGTKKFLVYENSALVETIDNLDTDQDSANYYATRINGRSSYIAIPTDDDGAATGIMEMTSGEDAGDFVHPANTTTPWNLATASVVNFATFGYKVSEFDSDTEEQVLLDLGKGYNGDTPNVEDVIGNIDPNTDAASGLQLFRDTEVVEVNVLCAPGVADVAVHQELALIAREINAFAFADIPDSTDANEPIINPRQSVDWHNGVGLFSNRSRIDSPNLAVFFNWFKIVDPFGGGQVFVPPTIGVLRCAARTFDREKPWFAFAGESRGIIDIALAVRFPKISLAAKSEMYGNGNGVNSILFTRGRIMVYGNRTMQVAESKLSAINAVILTNYIVNGMAAIARRFVFEPNDRELLLDLNNALHKLLESVKSERGIEEYNLLCDESNNGPVTRNLREVIVDVDFIPIDAVERIFLNATVRESGAVLNSVQ
jgi:phage tail sheath protein FI